MSNDKSWLVEGARVAEFDYNLAWFTTIERLTPRDVVLANGSRYRKATLRVGDTWHFKELRQADDPAVLKAVAAQKFRRDVATAEHMLKKWRNGDDKARLELIRFLQGIETVGVADGEA